MSENYKYLVFVSVDTNKFIKQDDCGYPYEVDYPHRADLWTSKEAALKWANHWPGKYELYHVTMTIEKTG